MLDETRKDYENYADCIVPGWRTLSKNDLCRMYVKCSDHETLRGGYFAALVVRYWGVLYKYQRNSPGFSPDDFYDWLIRALLYILSKHPWDDPTQKIYNDPNGPDKAVMRCLKSTRLIFYERYNTLKRRVNINTYSVENLIEQTVEGNMTMPESFKITHEPSENSVTHLIEKEFRSKNYFIGFMLYFIAFFNVFDTVVENQQPHSIFNAKRLAHYMHTITARTCQDIAENFNVDVAELEVAAAEFNTLNYPKLRNTIKRNLKALMYNKYFTEEY